MATTEEPTAGPPSGATWRDASKVDWYLERVAALAPRLAGEGVLREVLPPDPRAAADLGCGDGRLAALLLEERPGLEAVLAIDSSVPMLDRARERFADDRRVEVRAGDLRDPIGPIGAFDVVVSGFAVHHLEHDRKRDLFAEIAVALRPGGVFANLEVVTSETPELHAEFLAILGREADDPEDRLADIESQLRWMREAGLVQVGCTWRWRGMALLTGRAPDPAPPGRAAGPSG